MSQPLATGTPSVLYQAALEVQTALRDTGATIARKNYSTATLFNRLLERPVSVQWSFELNGTELTVYEFSQFTISAQEATEMALEAASTIEAGGTALSYHRLNGGELAQEFFEPKIGLSQLWWHSGPLLLTLEPSALQDDPNVALISQLLQTEPMRPSALAENGMLVRIANYTGLDFDAVSLVSDEDAQQIDYRRLPAGRQSGYHAVEEPNPPLQVHLEARTPSGGSYRSSSISLDRANLGEADHFTVLVRMIDGQLQLDFIEDDEIVTEAALVGLWYWVDAELANGESFDPVLEERPPYVEFLDTLAPNYNMPGLDFSGDTGCNQIGGIYHIGADNRLIVRDTATNFAGCPVPNQGLLLEILASNPSYSIDGDTFTLKSPTGERLTLSRTPPVNPN